MRVVAFAPAVSAVEEADGGLTATGFPLTSCQVDQLPAQFTVPTVVAVYAHGGTDYNPELFITVTGPDGRRVGSLGFSWYWDDNPPAPTKYRVFAKHVPVQADTPGVYTFALHDTPDDVASGHQFPLPVFQRHPLLGAP